MVLWYTYGTRRRLENGANERTNEVKFNMRLRLRVSDSEGNFPRYISIYVVLQPLIIKKNKLFYERLVA